MSNWYGSLNIDGWQECAVMGDKESVLREMAHYQLMYVEEWAKAEKRVTLTIQKGKSDER